MAVGRLNSEKDFDLLIRAHRRLRHAGLDHLLVILGRGPLRNDLSRPAQRLGVANSVIMPGYLANPYGAMKRATVFVLSSHVEGLPSVLLEALYLGIPIVVTNCPSGPAEILDNGRV
jgi:glycosyltransferase involved in cell wall biosynthesis